MANAEIKETEEILNWAEEHIQELKRDMVWEGGDSGYWKASPPQYRDRIRARAIAALAFLERFAGADSRWAVSAHDVFNKTGENQSMESGARTVGKVITEWVRMIRSGQVKPRLVESFNVRSASSTDLLEQVQALNAEREVVPAAPIVLAGVARLSQLDARLYLPPRK